MKCGQDGVQGAPTMPTNGPDKAHVIALPPFIVLATLALGLLLHFVWPMRFLARTDGLRLGALLIVLSIPIVIGAAWQLAKAKTAFDVRKPTTEIVTSGVFRISRTRLICP
jgi:protein-S-isoprenylcysteine O-methyltransferase Ste14